MFEIAIKKRRQCAQCILLQINPEGEDHVEEKDIPNALHLAGVRLPNYKVRDLVNDLKGENKIKSDGKVDKTVFKEVL